MKKILTIAGSDSGAGAGIQADIKTATHFGVYCSTVITAVTAQNTLGVQKFETVSLDLIEAQLDSIFSDIGADSVKTGMLANADIIDLVADKLNDNKVEKLVVDPVMVAKGGHKLLRNDAIEILCKKLIPLAKLCTPNIPEAEFIVKYKIENVEKQKKAAKEICDRFGCKATLVKGGHMAGEKLTDVLYDAEQENFYYFESVRIPTDNTHGTGCTYSAAIASNLTTYQLYDAVEASHRFLQQAIEFNKSIGSGHSPVNHFVSGLVDKLG